MMRNLKNWMLAAILICGTTTVLNSCASKEDNPTPSTPLPKTYNLVADEYKEALLDPLLEVKYMMIEQDQGETFTIDSPKAGEKITIHYYRPDGVGEEKTPAVHKII